MAWEPILKKDTWQPITKTPVTPLQKAVAEAIALRSGGLTQTSTPSMVAPDYLTPQQLTGELVSGMFPQLRILAGKLTGEDTTPFQEELDRRKGAIKLVGQDILSSDPEKRKLATELAMDIGIGVSGFMGNISGQINRIALSKSATEIAEIMTKMGADKTLIPQFSKILARIDDPRIISKIFNSELKPLLPKLQAPKTAETLQQSLKITDDITNPLLSEARKYKTTVNIQDKNDLEYLGRILSQDQIADIKAGKMTNFRGTPYEDLARVNIISETPRTIDQQLAGKIKEVKLKSDTFYHGTSAENARGIMQTGFKRGADLPEDAFRGGGYGKLQNSVSFTETPKDASRFSTLSKGGEIVEAKLKPNAKVVSIEGVEDAIDLEDYISYLKKQNIDAVYIGGGEKELVVINSKAITPTKSQLTDIWERANKGEPQKLLPGKTAILGDGFVMTEGRSRMTNAENLRRQQPIKAIKKETMEKAKAVYDKKVANIKSDKEILERRRNFIKVVKEHFGLDDADLKSITQRDIRLMSNMEFKQHLDRIRDLSEKLAERNQVMSQLNAQIAEKNLNIEPLRQALKLPKIANMTTSQLRELDQMLEPYMKDDVFLSKRKLETIERTELAGIKTYREAREILARKLGMKPEDLNNIKINEFDRFKGQSALSEKDPFFKMMIEDTAKLRLIREAEYLEIEKTVNELARKVDTTLTQKLIPQQKNIRAWFEASDKSTVQLTKAEADVVKFMQDEWIKARDYLIQINAMQKGIASENYFTHVRRGILEAVKEDGVIRAAKEVFEQYKLDEQVFNILDTQTGEVLALDKFFRFALRRTGGLKPTENIVGAFLNYMKTFKKKQALDEIVPLIDIYAHALTPKGTTQTGLLLHGDLVRFTKEWLNTQKGRRITLVAKQGGKIDWALKAGRTFTTLLDLGLNVPVMLAAQIGEQAIQYQLLGKGKFLLAKWRALGVSMDIKGFKLSIHPKGRRITAKYRNVIGKNPWGQLVEPMRNVGDRLGESLFVMFRDATVRRNRNVLLGSLTKEEWASETISPERLAQMQINTGRYGTVDGAGSIIGATPEAGLFTQYKTWAIPIVGSQLRNLKYATKFLVTRGASESVRGKRALLETYRMLELGAFVTLVGAYVVSKDDESFLGKLKQRAYMEAMTLFGAAPAIMSVPRLITYLVDLTSALGSIMKLETYKASSFGEYEAGDLKGVRQLERLVTPRALKQFETKPVKTLQDVKAEILKDIEDGTLSVASAKEKYISEVKKLKAQEKKAKMALPLDEYKKDLLTRIENKEITVSEAKEEFADYSEKNVDSFKSPDEGSFVDKVILHAKAIGTDPVTAFIFLFQKESIRRIDNGTIIVERMPLAESQQVRKERGATKELILDHTLPLQLGGGNGKDNLRLVTVDEWESYTPVENYLGDKLRAGLIDKKEAQRLIKEFKEGKITAQEIMSSQ